MLTLRPYQQTLLTQIRDAIRAGRKRICVTAPCGAGKTALVAAMLRGLAAKQNRGWFINHRREILRQSVRTLTTAADVSVGIVQSGVRLEPRELIQVCAIQSLVRRTDRLLPPQLIVWDECFVAGTKIGQTRELNIESVQINDLVTTWNQDEQCFDLQRVVATFKTPTPPTLYRISVGGREIICTGSHPFLRSDGWWKRAAWLEVGEELHGLRDLRETDETKSESSAALPSVLSLDRDDLAQSARRARANASQESDALAGESRPHESHAQEDRPQTAGAWRKWAAFAASGVVARLGARLAARSRGADGTPSRWITDALQTRHRQSIMEDRHRSGRQFSLPPVAASGRQEERDLSTFLRVDRIEVLERGSDGEFERVCSDGFVYNFETERTHTYIANGLVVHNCHHVASKSWATLHAQYPHAVHIGLTATPARLDGRGLGQWFDVLIDGPSTAQLIADGYLAPYRLIAPPSCVDLSGVHTVAGDYNKAEASTAMAASTVMGDALTEYQRRAAGKRALLFLWSLDASRETVARFQAAGISAAHVDGTTPERERDAIMARFASGTLRVLANVDLVSEGFDVPALDAVFLLRPTASLGLYLQQVGRALRPAPGKTALIVDHVGNYERHGLPDDPRVWSLDGDAKPPVSTLKVKTCPRCYAVERVWAARCSQCGAPFVSAGCEREVEQVAGELAEVDLDALRRQRGREEGDCRTLEALQALGRARGYASGWAWHRWQARQQRQRSA